MSVARGRQGSGDTPGESTPIYDAVVAETLIDPDQKLAEIAAEMGELTRVTSATAT